MIQVGGVYSQTDQIRMLLERLDKLISLLEPLNDSILSLKPEPEPEPPLSPPPTLGEIRRLLEVLVAGSLPSSPSVTHAITVGTTQTLVVTNEAEWLLPVEITNDDLAQALFLSGPGVIGTAGRRLLPEETVRYVMPIDTTIFGIVDVATIDVRVSEGFNIYSRMAMLEGPYSV